MPRMSASARREQLVEAAIVVLLREGLDHTTTRAITEQAGTRLSAFHYAFRDKDELLGEVVTAVAGQIEQVLREAIQPDRGLAAAIDDGLRGYWQHVIAEDIPWLVPIELAIHWRRTPGLEWRATRLWAVYRERVREVLQSAADSDPQHQAMETIDLAGFLVDAVTGLAIQYLASEDAEECARQLDLVIRAATLLTGLEPRPAGRPRRATTRSVPYRRRSPV